MHSSKHFTHRSLFLSALLPGLLLCLALTSCRQKQPVPKDLGLPQLRLQIGASDFNKIRQKRGEALARGYLQSSGKDYVTAQLQHNDQTYAAEIRLKGDWLDHLKGDKWSWRVKLTENDAVLGADQFSLQHPRTRHYLHEWVYHQLLYQEDILTPRYEFVELWLNDDYKGIYAFEAHFTESIIARQQRPAGVILKFNEDGFWETQNYRMRYGKNVTVSLPDFEAATIESFQKNKVLRDSSLHPAFYTGRQKLEALRLAQDNALTPELIDVDYWARFFALTDLAEAYHALRWHNMRWYYHPHTARLYPIGFDGYSEAGIYRWFRKDFLGKSRPKGNQVFFAEEFFLYFLFNHPEFQAAYQRQLLHYTQPAFVQSFLQNISPELKRLQIALKHEFPKYDYPLELLPTRAKALANAATKYNFADAAPFQYTIYDPMFAACETTVPLPSVGLKAFRVAGEAKVSVQNYYCRPITMEASGPKRSKPIHELREKLELPAFDIHQCPPPAYELPVKEKDKYLFYSVEGVDYWFKEKINPWPLQAADWVKSTQLQIDDSQFLVEGRTVRPRRVEICLQDLQIIPAGYTLAIPAACHMNLTSGAAILVYGNARLRGTRDAAIQIHSSDKTGRGIHFLQADTVSIQHLKLSNNQCFRTGGLLLNGAMTCQAKKLELQHLEFTDIDTEDALNVISSSQIKLEHLTFNNCTGDGLDIDFSSGEVVGGVFREMGGDAIDLSSSRIHLTDIEIAAVADKGISVGEGSTVEVRNARINRAYIGLANKDGSQTRASEIQLKNCSYGFTSFRKKPFFGGGQLEVENCQLDAKILYPYTLEEGQKLLVDGKVMVATHPKGALATLFYPAIF